MVLYELLFQNGKRYLGVSVQFEKRMRDHERAAERGKDSPLYRAIRKYGWANVRRSVLVVGPKEYILELEQRAIAAFDSAGSGGYNIALGGQTSPMRSAAVRAKVSASLNARLLEPDAAEGLARRIACMHTPSAYRRRQAGNRAAWSRMDPAARAALIEKLRAGQRRRRMREAELRAQATQ